MRLSRIYLALDSLIVPLTLLLLPQQAQAQLDSIIGPRRPPAFVHPQGFFTIQLPRGWQAKLDKDGNMIAHKMAGDKAELTLRMSKVPMNADTEMVAFNKGRKLRKLPHYVDGGGGRLKVSGKKASVHSFAFDYRGNTEYTIAVEEMYVVSGSILFTLHFEVLKRSMPHFKKDLMQIYSGLKVAEIDATGQPILPQQKRKKHKKKFQKLY